MYRDNLYYCFRQECCGQELEESAAPSCARAKYGKVGAWEKSPQGEKLRQPKNVETKPVSERLCWCGHIKTEECTERAHAESTRTPHGAPEPIRRMVSVKLLGARQATRFCVHSRGLYCTCWKKHKSKQTNKQTSKNDGAWSLCGAAVQQYKAMYITFWVFF